MRDFVYRDGRRRCSLAPVFVLVLPNFQGGRARDFTAPLEQSGRPKATQTLNRSG
jgi:hypothetical protein